LLTISRASEKFGVPKSTICNHVKALSDNKKINNPGGQTVLSHDEEKNLVIGLIKCGEWGFPLKCRDIQLAVKSYLDRLGKKTRFKNNWPGKDWVDLFLNRNNELTLRIGENIKRVRAAVSKSVLNEYFDNLSNTLSNVPPSHIFNYDETNFVDDPGKSLVVVRRGTKHPEVVKDTSKTSVSVMFCVSADGNILPPYTVYKAKHIYPTWIEGGIQGAGYNRNDSGWFDMPIFEDWFLSCFLPSCRHLTGPKVIIGDNLASHISLEVIKHCEMNNIRFVLLPPNSTHLCQPLDVAVFRPMKRSWRKTLDDWKNSNSGPIPKCEFPKLLKKCIDSLKNSMSDNIKSGFIATDIFPLNKNKVIDKLPSLPEEDELSEDLEKSKWTEAFVEILSDLRNPKHKVTKTRGKKLNVPAGKSIRIEDIDKSIDPDDPDIPNEIQENPIYIASPSYDKQDSVLSYNSDPDDSDTSNENQEKKNKKNRLETICEDESLSEHTKLKKGDFIVVKYEMSKRDIMYIAQVEKEENPLIKLNFVRMKNNLDGSAYFIFPQNADKSNVTRLQVIRKLVPHKMMKRGRFTFNIDTHNFN